MKTIRISITFAVWALVLGCMISARAAGFLWNVSTPGANAWNIAGNWIPNGGVGVAGPADTNIFGAVGTSPNVTTVNNVVTANTAISSLQYTNTAAVNTAYHITQIPSGVTLTVTTNLSVSAPGAVDAVATYAAMRDAGTLLVTGSTLNVQDNGNTVATAVATLDLSPLSNFVYSATSGTINVAGGTGTRVGGILLLAASSNNVTAGTINLGTGSGAQAGNGGNAIRLGSGTNNINVGTLNIVNNKNSGSVSFLTQSGGLRLRGVGGTDADRATIIIGNRNQTGTGTTTGTALLNGHPVDIKAGTITIASDLVTGGNAAVGSFSFNQGSVDATAVNLAASGTSAVTGSTGTMSVGTAGTLVVNNVSLVNQSVAQTTGSALGNLYVTNGGTLICSNGIVKTTSLGVGNVNFSSASVTMVGGTIGTVATPVDNLSITNSTLNLPVAVNNSPTNIAVNNLNVGAAPSTINISSLPAVGSYPATFRLINYGTANGDVTTFILGPLPGTFTGNLAFNSGGIDLVVTGGPTPPPASRNVSWDGQVSPNWDTTTTNWTEAGILTNYNNVTASGFGDTVTFDDTLLGTTNVNLTQTLSPGSVSVNNTLSNYVFTGSGKITGAIGLTKQGTGSLTIANAANDFSGPITLTGGTLIYDQGVDATVANTITGSGSIVKNNANILTLSAINNGLLGGVTVNAGTLRLAATNAAGTTTPLIVNNATLVVGATNLNGITLSNATLGVANFDYLMAANKELVISPNSTNLLLATDPQSPTVSRNIEVDGVLRGSGAIVIANANGVTSPDGNNGVRFRNTTVSSDFSGTIIVTNNSKSELLLQGPGPFSPVGTGKFIFYAGLYDGNNLLTGPATGAYLEFNFRNTGSTTAANDYEIVGNGAVVINGLGSPNGAVTTVGNLKIGNNQELIGYRAAGTTTNSVQFTTVALAGGNSTFSPHSSSFGVATQAGTDFSLGNISELTPGSGITMGGRGNLTLTGVNTYTGNTSVTNGVLLLNGSASIATSPNIVIGNGARLDVSGLTAPFALSAAQTLSNLNSTAVIAGNADASLGTLSLIYASGTPSFTIANSTLTLAGTSTININNTGAALAKGSYKIISATGTGSVAGTVPSSVTVTGGGIATAVTPSLQITSSELYLVVPNSPPVIAHIVTNAAPAGGTYTFTVASLQAAAGWSDADNDTVTFNNVGPTSNLGALVAQDGPNILYNPPLTNAEDFFTYTVTDGATTTQGTVYIEVTAATPPPPATGGSVSTDVNGVATINFTGNPNSTNIVQASTNLLDWFSISTNVADGTGLWQVTDSDATNSVYRFYRSYQPLP